MREREAPPGDLERPPYSVLDNALCASLLGRAIRDWHEALSEYVRLVQS